MQPVEDRASFPVQERIKSSLAIKAVMDEKKHVSSFPIKCFYRIVPKTDAATQLAVVASKRRFKHAVDRNRIKRLMREAYRLNKHTISLPEGLTLQMCWIYVSGELPDAQSMMAAAAKVFSKIQSAIAES